MIWSRDTGQQIHVHVHVACYDSCQITITWMPKNKDVGVKAFMSHSHNDGVSKANLQFYN